MVWERVELPDGDSVGTLCGVHLIGSTWSVRPHPSHCPYNLVPLLQTAVASDLIEPFLRRCSGRRDYILIRLPQVTTPVSPPQLTRVGMGEDRGSDPLPVKQRLPCARSTLLFTTVSATSRSDFSDSETRKPPPDATVLATLSRLTGRNPKTAVTLLGGSLTRLAPPL